MTLERLYLLHQILTARRYPVSTQVLMDRLDCSRSTLHRTITYLRNYLKAPLLNKPGQGYFYDASVERFELPGIWFRSDELHALLVMEHLLERMHPGLLHKHIEPLRRRLRETLEAGTGTQTAFPTHRIRILRTHARPVIKEQFVPIAAAVIERRKLAFTYTARATNQTTQRRTSPQRIVYYRDQWYVDCWDETKRVLRTFSMDRIREPEKLDRPAREIAEDKLNNLLTRSYGIFSGKPRHRAKLRFTAERARWVADESWHSDQTGRCLSDGRYELTIPYANPSELVGEILRHGEAVEVVQPRALVELVRRQLELALAQYPKPSASVRF